MVKLRSSKAKKDENDFLDFMVAAGVTTMLFLGIFAVVTIYSFLK